MRKLKTKVSKKRPSLFEEERLPDWEAIKQTEFYLSFAKDYIHNGHSKGATDALKSIKRATTVGLKITEVK